MLWKSPFEPNEQAGTLGSNMLDGSVACLKVHEVAPLIHYLFEALFQHILFIYRPIAFGLEGSANIFLGLLTYSTIYLSLFFILNIWILLMYI